jgi:predicted dienelactone hydrolase
MLTLKQISAIAAVTASAALPASAAAQDLRMPDTRDAAERQAADLPQLRQDLRMPDRRAPASAPTVVRIVDAPPAKADGFDWTDAGIGAAGGLAILTLAGGMGLVATQRRRVRTA